MADLPDRWRPGDPLSAAKLAQLTKALSSAIGVPTTSDGEPGRSGIVYRLAPFRAGEPITAAQLNDYVRALNSRWRVPTTSSGKECASLPDKPARPWAQGETITAAKLNELVTAATQREQVCKDSASETTEEPLEPPTDVSATDGAHADKVTVTWTASVDAPAEYEVYRATSAGGPYTLLDTVAAVTVDDGPTGVDPFRPYWYQVRSLDGAVTSFFAGPDDGYRTMRPPTSPSASDDEESYIRVQWTLSVDSADTYQIARSSTSGGTYTNIATVSGTTFAYIDYDVGEGETWWYKIRACKTGLYSGCSEYTTAISGETVSELLEGLIYAAYLDYDKESTGQHVDCSYCASQLTKPIIASELRFRLRRPLPAGVPAFDATRTWAAGGWSGVWNSTAFTSSSGAGYSALCPVIPTINTYNYAQQLSGNYSEPTSLNIYESDGSLLASYAFPPTCYIRNFACVYNAVIDRCAVNSMIIAKQEIV